MTNAAEGQCEYRLGSADDALCVGVLATQVFLDTYATDGVRPDLAREVIAGYSPEAFFPRLADQNTTFVLAECRRHLVGFVEVTANRPCPVETISSKVEIVRSYVQRAWQRRGIGRRLILESEQIARGHGQASLWLAAWRGNERAEVFYEAFRYRRVGAVEHVIEGQSYENHVYYKALNDGQDS